MSGGFPEWRYDPKEGVSGACEQLTPRKGRILFQVTPGTAPASANGMYVGEWYYSTTSYIRMYFSANNTITLAYMDKKGTARSGTWDCTLAFNSGTAYEVKIEYDDAEKYMKLYIDDVLKITISNDVRFDSGSTPFYYKLGTTIGGTGTYTSTTYTAPTMSKYDY